MWGWDGGEAEARRSRWGVCMGNKRKVLTSSLSEEGGVGSFGGEGGGVGSLGGGVGSLGGGVGSRGSGGFTSK